MLFISLASLSLDRRRRLSFSASLFLPRPVSRSTWQVLKSLWSGLMENWKSSLSSIERQFFTRLETDNERDAFRIVRSFARKAEQDGAADFPIVRDNLASRLGITGKGAAGIRDKLARLGAISKTMDYVPNKFAARFKWLLPKSFK